MKIISHRGANREFPENTFAAFERALEIGVDAIETDLLLTKERRIVVRHDDLILVNGKMVSVSELTVEQIQKINFVGGERVPTLEEFFERCGEKCPIFLDLKSYGLAAPLSAYLKKTKLRCRVHVTSFLHEEISEIAKLLPDIERSLIFTALPPAFEPMFRVSWTREVSLFRGYLNEGQAESLRRAKIKMRVFPVNRPEEAKRFAGWGADAIFTDVPEQMRSLRGAPKARRSNFTEE